MNRRGFLRAAFASTATIVIAPVAALEALDELAQAQRHPGRVFVDMGRYVTPVGYCDVMWGLVHDSIMAMYRSRQMLANAANAFAARIAP